MCLQLEATGRQGGCHSLFVTETHKLQYTLHILIPRCSTADRVHGQRSKKVTQAILTEKKSNIAKYMHWD